MIIVIAVAHWLACYFIVVSSAHDSESNWLDSFTGTDDALNNLKPGTV